MSNFIKIKPLTKPLSAQVRPPGSKSITNRALVCAALAEGTSTLSGALVSEDTGVMIDGLAQLGIATAKRAGGETLDVAGCGGAISLIGADLFVANSGTTMRFLTALVTLGHGRFRLDGIERMRQRPIGELLDVLGKLGADVRSEQGNDCPPVLVDADGLPGGKVRMRGEISSQPLSGLLMAAPYARQPVEIEIDGPLVSRPYVRMTMAVMSAFGVDVEADENLTYFGVPNDHGYKARHYDIEPDASAASYFFAAAAVTGGEVTVLGLDRDSLQGDVAFCECLARMGCEVEYGEGFITVRGRPLAGVEVDMNSISDTVQTLAAVALFAQGPTTITGVAHIRHKETDRIGDLARELRRLGANVTELDDGIKIEPGRLTGAEIETYNDHRMAMSLAVVGLKLPRVTIKDPSCTGKTYPKFFDELASLGV